MFTLFNLQGTLRCFDRSLFRASFFIVSQLLSFVKNFFQVPANLISLRFLSSRAERFDIIPHASWFVNRKNVEIMHKAYHSFSTSVDTAL